MPRSRTRWLVPAALAALLPVGRGLADAPPGRYVVHDAGTVTDSQTGLTWQRASDPNLHAFGDAGAYCRALALAGGGFRLPTMKELETLVDRRQNTPAIDRTFFPATPSERFWSGSPYARNTADSWAVDFDRGGATHLPVMSALRVRCVR